MYDEYNLANLIAAIEFFSLKLIYGCLRPIGYSALGEFAMKRTEQLILIQ